MFQPELALSVAIASIRIKILEGPIRCVDHSWVEREQGLLTCRLVEPLHVDHGLVRHRTKGYPETLSTTWEEGVIIC